MSVPYTFATATGDIPLTHLDENFSNVKNASYTAGTVTSAAQPNITSVGTLTSLTVSGNVTASNFIGTIAGNISNAVYAINAGTVTTAAQPNITSVGNLTSVTVTGNVNGGNFMANGIVSAPGNITSLSNISGNYILGNAAFMTGIPVSYGNSNVTTLLANLGSNTVVTTGNITGGNVTGTHYGAGTGLSSIPGANVSGTVANATYATSAGTVTTNAQPNITSVGTLTSVSVSGNITGGNLISSGNIATLSDIKRVIHVENTAPTSGDGAVGDIWYQTY